MTNLSLLIEAIFMLEVQDRLMPKKRLRVLTMKKVMNNAMML